MDKINCVVKTWQELHDYAKQTADRIKGSDFHPDIIIGLSRGGLVPARLFCDFLHVKNCFTIKVDHWGLTATKDGKARLTHKLDMDLTGKKVLIVDDITDTGQSMELAKKHIEELNPSEIKTATLVHLNNSKYTPDFYGHERPWAWIVFPWNHREDMVNLINKILGEEEKAIDKIKEELKMNFNLDLESPEIEEVLVHIRYLDSVKK
jgi:hypoxanthine phosphoribosyltransferase